ncbi:MAG: hypothetical protein K9L78_02410 [Victivallales bacterium]|nr:hypothetical protein [Victivallales bacterium]MCF7888948.1 hypothetical protein [Victivallales bacterium]
MDIETFIIDYISSQNKKFTLNDIKDKQPGSQQVPDKILVDYLEESSLIFIMGKNGFKEYLPRHLFFNGSSFIISPSEEEINKGILFPGHKFIPFYNPALFPCESFTISTPETDVIGTTRINCRIKDLYKYYFLLGAESIIDNFVADYPENKKLLERPENKIKITVFDFKNLYRKHSFFEGDYLKFEVADWSKGSFSVSVLKKESIQEETKKFIDKLEASLYCVFEKCGIWLDIPEQLAHAYFESDNDLVNKPVLSIDEFVDESEGVQVKFNENQTVLWYPDKEEDKKENATELLSLSSGTLESIDSILKECSNFVTSVELTAFIKDSLQNEISEPEQILSRCFPEAKPQFIDNTQKVAFHNQFEEILENLAKDFVKDDPKIAEIRSEILYQLEDFYSFFDNRIKETGTEIDMDSINQNILYIRKILTHLNIENLAYTNDEEIEQLDNLVFKILSEFNRDIEYLE